ncbi:hypothetical protein FEM08_06290 [Flavobacterium gilvum]|nr:hypothetical protein FEM08_06290 [Flavobacterium gilvum]
MQKLISKSFLLSFSQGFIQYLNLKKWNQKLHFYCLFFLPLVW